VKTLCSRHDASLVQCCPEEYDALKLHLDAVAAPTDAVESKPLHGCLSACGNHLVEPYVAFLASAKSEALLKELGIAGLALSSRPGAGCCKATDADATTAAGAACDEDPDDYAAGW